MDIVALLWTLVLVGAPLAVVIVVGRLTWTLATRSRPRAAVVPLLVAVGVTVVGVVLVSIAPPGLEGLGHALGGFYLAVAGGVTALVVAGVLVAARIRLSQASPRRDRTRPDR